MVSMKTVGENGKEILDKDGLPLPVKIKEFEVAFFIISTILIGGYLAFYHSTVFWKAAHWPLVTCLMALAVTAIEAVSGKGTDNITVPISTLCLLILIG